MSLNKKDFFDQLLKNHLSAQHARSTAEPCPDENWVAAYLEGSQSEHFKATFERHLLQCNRCRSELALLLKASAAEAKPAPAAKAAESDSPPNLLTSLLGWVRGTTLRPAFAILLVCVVTGVVGYKVLRDNHLVMHRWAETAESVSMSNSPVAVPPEPSRAESPSKPQDFKEAAGGGRQAARDEGTGARLSQLKTDELERRSRTKSQDREMKDTFAVEPPSSAPARADKDVVGVPKRRDMASEPRSSAAPLQKEALSTPSSERQNSQLQAKAEESAGQPQNQVTPAAPAQAQPARAALAGTKTEQDKIANVEESAKAASAEKKKQVLAERSQQSAAFSADETGAVKHLESGGKRFELSDGVWRDASILSSDPPPMMVKLNSPEFNRHRKEFAPYQQLLARPEDVLIKIGNQVLRIKKAP